jgi:hypothetical protein
MGFIDENPHFRVKDKKTETFFSGPRVYRLVGKQDFRKNVRLAANLVLVLGKKHAIGQLVADALLSDTIQQLVSSPSTVLFLT